MEESTVKAILADQMPEDPGKPPVSTRAMTHIEFDGIQIRVPSEHTSLVVAILGASEVQSWDSASRVSKWAPIGYAHVNFLDHDV